MSRRPKPSQKEVCTRQWKAGRRCKPCQVTRVLVYRPEDPVTARHRDSLANIRSRVNPRISAKEKTLGLVVVEHREKGRIRISLRVPLAGPKLNGSGIRDHREIDRRDRWAKAGVRHVAESAGPILQGRHILVEIHKFAEQLIGPLSR